MLDRRSAKRTYSQTELVEWFERICSGWESAFSAEMLEMGRALYTSFSVKNVDITFLEALVQVKLADESEAYSIIEYLEGAFSFRSSCENKILAGAIAVAGLYEIEELVCEELYAWADFEAFELKSKPEAKPSEPEIQETETPQQTIEVEIPKPLAMEIVLHFSIKPSALAFTALWKTPAGMKRVFGANSLETTKLNDSERERLIKLTTLTRKSNFKFERENFKLDDFAQIPNFVSKTLPKWEEFFTIKKGDGVDLLKLGERNIKLNSSAKEDSLGSFEFSWSATIGDKNLAQDELSKIFGLAGAPRILANYGIVRVNENDENFIRHIERAREISSGKIPRYMLLTLFDMPESLKLSPALAKWRKAMLSKKPFADIEKEIFPEFLRNYQRMGLAWLERIFSFGCNALLADEMGLGKTVQSLSMIAKLWDKGGQFLIVCPASVIPVWISEVKKFYPHIEAKAFNSESNFKDGRFWVASYTQLRRNKEALESIIFDLAILDEAQFIKNPESKTTIACMGIAAKRKIALTGTPLENRALDLWTIFRWIMPGLLGSRAVFENFLLTNENALQILRKQISPFVLRRMKSEVAAELPEKIYVDLACPLTQLQSNEYDKIMHKAKEMLVAEGADKSKMQQNRIHILSLITRLRQAACDAALLPWFDSEDHLSSGKISVLLDKIEELALSGKKILVFSQFTSLLSRVKNFVKSRISDLPIYELTGQTKDRSKPVSSFQNAAKEALILVSLRAGGTGITLSSADYVFFMDPWWNPAVEEQAIDRVHRIGRSGDVFVYRMIAEGTVEERVRKLQSEKRKLFDDLFSGLTDISNSDAFFETVSKLLQ